MSRSRHCTPQLQHLEGRGGGWREREGGRKGGREEKEVTQRAIFDDCQHKPFFALNIRPSLCIEMIIIIDLHAAVIVLTQ